jgi:hypothetical protein
MSIFTKLLGTVTGVGVSEAATGIGKAAISIRTALTGDLPPEVKEVLIKAEAEVSKAQSNLNELDAQSASFFRAGWRPATAWICVFGLGYSALFRPIVNGLTAIDMPATEAAVLSTLLIALLGLGGMRTAEKYKKIK